MVMTKRRANYSTTSNGVHPVPSRGATFFVYVVIKRFGCDNEFRDDKTKTSNGVDLLLIVVIEWEYPIYLNEL